MSVRWSQVEELSGAELKDHAQALQTVLAITQAISRCTSLQDLAEQTVEAITEFTHYPCVGLFARTGNDLSLELLAARGFSAEVVQAVARLPIDSSLNGAVVRASNVVHVPNLGDDSRIEASIRRLLLDQGFHQVTCVPLSHHGRVVAVLNLLDRERTELSEHACGVLQAIGQTIACAMVLRQEIAKRNHLEAESHRNERLESLGLLAGGIAHDFNNFLQVLLASLGILRQRFATEDLRQGQIEEHVSESTKAIGRARDLVAQLLTFSRGGAPLKRPSGAMTALIRDAAEFSGHGSSVRLEIDVPAELPTLEIDSAQFAQVVQNLVFNAIEASPAGGKVCIRATMEPTCARKGVARWPEINDEQPPLSLCLVVQDFGCGIAPEHLGKIFQPYFTTKRDGHGLGLAIAHSIVARHGGSIAVESRVGQGTSFAVKVPTALASRPANPSKPYRPPRLSARLLVLEDEPAITRLLKRALGSLGYAFDLVFDGQSAIDLAKLAAAKEQSYDLLVFDLTIRGGVGGREALRAIRSFAGPVRAIATTGYSTHSVDELLQEGFAEILPKPYTLDQLEQVIERSLDLNRDGHCDRSLDAN